MKFKLPPHIAWPLFVVLILGVGIVGAFSILFAAASDGGAQVVDDYYRRAVAWDSTAAENARAAALGWRVDFRVLQPTGENSLRPVRFTVVDSTGSPVESLAGTVRLFRPQHAAPVAELPFHAEAGSYGFQAPLTSAGLWDFEISGRRDSTEYRVIIRKQVGR
jgi:nitrogen fixation protein FixH